MKIAICITTHNRPDVFSESLKYQHEYLPAGGRLFIVDDASNIPVESDYRFESRAGIPRAKNKCLELANEWGADHIFLFDDDTYPISNRWSQPYIEHPAPHLMYIFTGFGNQTKGIREVYRDAYTVAYDHVRGCMLYLDSKILEVVGGYDVGFGIGMYEHTDLTNRIFNAGLTPYRVMDVPNSDRLIYSMDEHEQVNSTFTPAERNMMMTHNRKLKLKYSSSAAYKEFR